jgi:hypothetical protein
LELKALHNHLQSLTTKEKRHLLLNAESLQRLQRAWTAPSANCALAPESAK